MSLGSKCKLFILKQWNSLSWTKIHSTEMCLRTLYEQNATKARVTNAILQMRFLFGRAKAGIKFKTEREIRGYVSR